VPGLAAKPVIDILLLVADSADEPSYVPALEAAGYRLRIREPDWFEHRALRRRVSDGDHHDVNLHVFSRQYAADEITRVLGFRDWLRTHEYVQNYADAKTDVIEEIHARAGLP
jgi:GrpB-like predicted nucleotidyltransferase (UPF0157 family)